MLYKEASRIIHLVQRKQGTVKSLVHSSDCKNIKQLYALVCQTLKYSSIIDQILKNTKLLEQEKWLEKSTAQVLLYEMLFGKGIQCGGKYRLAIKRHKSALTSALVRIKIKMGVVNNKDLLPQSVKDEVILPRYVRVNLLKSTVDDVIQTFIEESYHCILSREQADTKRKEARNADDICKIHANLLTTLEPHQFMCDVHLEDLLVFPPATDFHDHHLYKTGAIILQDKASCLPAYLLAPPPGSHVIDACAAPGNKTSHLAASLKNTGKVFAFDVDPKRVSTLSKMTALSGATNVEIINQDFLKVNPGEERFSNVRYILMDPSCSGSGIVSRLDHLTNDSQSDSTERLEGLAAIQAKLLGHALSFPHVERVVYSTCSVHQTENERVVLQVLASRTNFELELALPTWKNRGICVVDDNVPMETSLKTGSPDVSACLRAVPKEDCTNGFFVAVLKRKIMSAKQEQTRKDTEPLKNGRKRNRNKRRKNQTTPIQGFVSNTVTVSDPREMSNQGDCTNDGTKRNRGKRRKRKRSGAGLKEAETKLLKASDTPRGQDCVASEHNLHVDKPKTKKRRDK
ncbi:28S rRNA (cytosine-C(5))-methyltransferase-like [Patiria miniata]|uniref:SAM-dependent MTase RsmB/NOP-type domain-containing protein n=1 Tax=Patiria miniata TaxID=46514 RepID=A0A914ABJ4_PATMI|nr:28S rRNA (cytosine-C(5))-methyltransferase-like [Patiria miniata]